MINCIPDTTGKVCVNCGWQWTRDTPFPHRNCPRSPDLKPAAAKLGLTEWPPALAQLLAQWLVAGCPERSEEEVRRIRNTADGVRCDNADGFCTVTGCDKGEKKIKCEWLARMATASCPKSFFGDKPAEVAGQVKETTDSGLSQ